MDRRTFLGAALVLVPGAVAEAPVRRQPIVLWSRFNATVAPGYSALHLVPLVVYADGTAVADASFIAPLGRSTAGALARMVAGVLRRPAPPPHDAPVGAATTQLEAWPHGRHLTGSVAAPPSRLSDRREWIVAHGTPYAPHAVRLIVVVDPAAPDFVPAWPAAVPVPPVRPGSAWSQVDLTGAPASACARALPGGTDWTPYRMPDGSALAAAWRRLLPHEIHLVPQPTPGSR